MEYPNQTQVNAIKLVEHISYFLAYAKMFSEEEILLAVKKLSEDYDCWDREEEEMLGKITLYLEKKSKEEGF